MTEVVSIGAPVFEGDRAPFAKAFVAAQKATESISKAASNPAFKSKYADLAAVVEGVVPALNASGIGVIQSPSFDGQMVALTTILIHESGATCTATLHMRPSKLDPQGVGSAITYARRYALLAMTGSAPEDDDGNAASGPRQEPVQRPAEPPKAPSLAERANALEARLKAVTDADGLEKAIKLASGLMADLDDKDPERLAAIDLLIEQRRDGFSKREPVAA